MRVHADKIRIETPLRVRAERRSNAVTDPTAWRVIGHADVHPRPSIVCRFEAHYPGMCDGCAFDGAPGERLIRHERRDLGIKLHGNAGRTRHGPMRLAFAGGWPLRHARTQSVPSSRAVGGPIWRIGHS